MRTTITLDAEAEALIKKEMEARKVSFKQVVNEAVVRGLTNDRVPRQFRTKTRSMGRALIDLDKSSQVVAQLDNEEFLRKMAKGE